MTFVPAHIDPVFGNNVSAQIIGRIGGFMCSGASFYVDIDMAKR